ncbi:MAG: phage tail tape measure protein, partial [Schleiferiaceae bacterium]
MADAKVGIEVEVNAKQAKTTLSNLGKTTQKNAKGMSAALGSVTKSVIGLTASFASLRTAVATVQEFSRFQRAMAEVSTLVDTTTMDMSNLTQQARSLAIEFGQAPTEQAKAFYQTISAGATDSATAIETMRVANKLAVGGVTSVENAVDGLTSVMNAYGVEQDGINDLADIFFTGMKKGKTTVGKLAFEIGRIAPIAAASGVAFDELTAAIAATTTGGIRTETAVIGLRQTLASINKPSGDAQKEAKRLGIEFNVAALKAKGLVGVLKSITSSSKFTENSMSKLFGNIRALTSVLALTGNEGKKLAETLEAMATRAGNADEATEKMTKTFGFQFDRFNAGMKATVAQMVELTGVTSVMGVAMSFWSDMMEKAQRAQTVTVEGLTDFKTGMQDAIKVIAEGTGQSTQTVFTRLRNELGLTSVQIIQRAKELTEKLKAEAREREADEQKQVRARAEAEEKAAAEATARRKKQIKEAQKRAKRMQQMLQDEIRGLEEHRIEEDKKKRERLAA